jgi:hypothetical protein
MLVLLGFNLLFTLVLFGWGGLAAATLERAAGIGLRGGLAVGEYGRLATFRLWLPAGAAAPDSMPRHPGAAGSSLTAIHAACGARFCRDRAMPRAWYHR